MHKKIDSSIGMSYFGVVFEAGGIWEDVGTRGCSHLMEHLMCKTYQDLYPKMRALGVQDNAFTSDNRVVFWAAGLDENLKVFSQVIFDRITGQEKLWTQEEFDNEKNIILQEYAVAFNSQMGGSYYNAMRTYYGYGGAIGIRKDIENFTYEQSLDFAKKSFSIPKLICTVGNHDVIYNGEFSNSKFPSGAKWGKYDIEHEVIPKEGQSIVFLLNKNPLKLKDTVLIDLISSCIGDGLESPLYQEIREKRGLAYGASIFGTNIGEYNVPIVAVETKEKTKKKVVKVLKDLFSQDMKDIISEDRFNICKSGILCEKKVCEILPHTGALKTVISDINPFDGLENINYKDVIEYANNAFSFNNFESITY